MYLCVFAGCKIKELRAKTNTYIKTPVRGEEPVFIVTGRKEDVQRAEFEIKQQSQHFSEIRANRQQVGIFIQFEIWIDIEWDRSTKNYTQLLSVSIDNTNKQGKIYVGYNESDCDETWWKCWNLIQLIGF